MSNLETEPSPSITQMSPERPVIDLRDSFLEAREAKLHELLGTDYDYATEKGLIDLFYFNPETGEDRLIHTLAGEAIEGEDGAKVVMGFHHEPSGEALWPIPASSEEIAVSPTRVDRSQNDLNSKKRKEFAEYPYEPYKAKVFIDNAKKLAERKDPATGEIRIDEAKNGMYPKEYDALTVLQAINMAYQNRDIKAEENSIDHEGRSVIVSEGYAPMLDGESLMKIRMVLDPETKKIMTAMPPVVKPGVMRLSKAAVREHLGI